MKYMKRAQIWQACNYKVTFNPKKLEAVSYNWWVFVKLIDEKLVFNNYRYSAMTTKHQWKIRALLRDLGIKIDIEMPLSQGLQEFNNLEAAILEAEEQLCDRFFSEILKKQDKYQKRKEKLKARELSASVPYGVYPPLVLVKHGG